MLRDKSALITAALTKRGHHSYMIIQHFPLKSTLLSQLVIRFRWRVSTGLHHSLNIRPGLARSGLRVFQQSRTEKVKVEIVQ